MLRLCIISYDFALSRDRIKDGLTHRYYGMYATMLWVLSRSEHISVSWHATTKKLTLEIDDKHFVVRQESLFQFIKHILHKDIPSVILLDYPHAYLGVRTLPEFVLSLLFIHIIRLLRKVFLIIDMLDPPIEHLMELKDEVNLLEKIHWLILNHLVNRADLIIMLSESYRSYYSSTYEIKKDKIVVVYCGSYNDIIKICANICQQDKYTHNSQTIRIVYAKPIVSQEELKSLEKYINVARERFNVNVELIITGKAPVKLDSSHDLIRFLDVIPYMEYVKLLCKADILIIPYRLTLHHLLTTRAKLGDYLMTGKHIICRYSLGLKEVVKLIRTDRVHFYRSNDDLPQVLTHVINKVVIQKQRREYCRFEPGLRSLDYRLMTLNFVIRFFAQLRKWLGVPSRLSNSLRDPYA